MSQSPVLSVIVPAYREGRKIHANLVRLLATLDTIEVEYEVLVISDGNTDDTVSEAERVPSSRVRVLAYDVNEGKGFAIMHGVRQARGRLISYIDADMEIAPEGLATCVAVQREGDWDVIVGSKRHPRSEVAYPWPRRVQSWIYQLLIGVLFQLDVRDTQTGLKLFRGEVLRAVVPLLAVKRFAFDLELLVVARKLGFKKIVEVPITISYQFETTTSVAGAYHALWDTAAIFYRLHFLRYYDRRLSRKATAWSRRKDDVRDLADRNGS